MQEYLRQAKPEQLRLGGIGLITIVFAAMVFYVIVPQWRAYGKASNSLETLQQGVIEGVDLDVQLSALGAEIEDLKYTLHGDTSNLPLRQVEAFVIGRLQTISWKNHVELVGVRPRTGSEQGPFRELLFDLELRGDYFDLYAWLKNVSSELGFIVVKKFEMSRDRVDDEQPVLLVKLTMASYRNADE
jgi:Tfp pilus assembly protein PilO